MRLMELKCKNCGAKLKIEDNVKKVTCKYCNTEKRKKSGNNVSEIRN